MFIENDKDCLNIKLKPNKKFFVQILDKNKDEIKNTKDNIKRIILVGKMASGKDWLKHKLIEKLDVKPEISYTSRPMREGEVEGITYNFITKEAFEKMINEDAFYEYTKFVDWYYGTTYEEFENKQIFIMNPEGLSKVKKKDLKNSFVIYLDIPEELRRERLKNRDMNYDSVERRIIADNKDFEGVYCDYTIKIQVIL